MKDEREKYSLQGFTIDGVQVTEEMIEDWVGEAERSHELDRPDAVRTRRAGPGELGRTPERLAEEPDDPVPA